MSADVVIIGGGIIGCSAAAFLAERGATVSLFESTVFGAGASGRNSGAVQHPFDPLLLHLHRETLDHYRRLADEDRSFAFPSRPAGLLLLTDDGGAAHARAAELSADHPELEAAVLAPADLRDVEPILADDLFAVRLSTGYPIPPHAATGAWADRARRAGARLEIGRSATPMLGEQRVRGVRLADGEAISAGSVLLATGPWLPDQVDPSGSWRPIVRTWGVTVHVDLPNQPRHILEEGVVHTVNRVVDGGPAVDDGEDHVEVESLFSLVSAGGANTLGSTFIAREPDSARIAPLLVQRGARLVPDLEQAAILGHRLCARPQSLDGRPLLGRLAGNLFVCAGHGPWGISTGPATARLVAETILDGLVPPPELAADRFGRPALA